MKWLLIAVTSAAALAAFLWIAGSLLPKGHTASRALRLKQPPEEVWKAITDRTAMPSWRPNVAAVERLPDQNEHEVWQEVYKNGWKSPLETVVWEPPWRLVGRIADPNLAFGGTWTYEITPASSGCALKITEEGEVYNPVFRLFSRFSDQRRTITEYLTSLARKFGEAADFEN